MFSLTYLGQQGWLVASDRTRVLVDPLLTTEYSPGFSAVIHPPRRLALAKFPPIDAVVLSHEHADHVNLPSLMQLDRRIPVILSERAAAVVRDAIAKLGFRVIGARPRDRFSIGDLRIDCFASEHRDDDLEGEWACLQLLVTDRGGDGSFFTYVDGIPRRDTIAAIAERGERIGVFCHANNVMDWSCIAAGQVAAERPDTLSYAANVMQEEAAWWRDRAAPALTVVCGPGLAFVGEDAWMNQILTADSERVAAALAIVCPERRFAAPRPGETIQLRRGRLHRTLARTRFAAAVPRARWPSLATRPIPLLERFGPACGRMALDDADWSALFVLLDRLGGFLYGRSLFRALHRLDARDLGGRRADFALVLRAGADDAAYVCEYLVNESRFALVECADPAGTYVLGLECWGSDLHAVLTGAMMPQRLLGHARTWSFAPDAPSPLFALWRCFDFVHSAEAGAAFYAQILARPPVRPTIAAGAARVRRAR